MADKRTVKFHLYKILKQAELDYSWPLNNAEIRGHQPQHSQKYTCNFCFPQNLTNGLLLTRSLTNNINYVN